MNKEAILGVVRHILTAAGGYLVAKGQVDAEVVAQAVGAIVTLVGLAWSVIQKQNLPAG